MSQINPVENFWIVNSEITNHMINTKHFHIYLLYSNYKKIVTTNGSLNTTGSKKNIKINPIIILENMLYISKLIANIVSVNKLLRNLNCKVTKLIK